MQVDGVALVPHKTDGDAIGTVAVFALQRQVAVFSPLEQFIRTGFVHQPVLPADFFIGKLHGYLLFLEWIVVFLGSVRQS